MQMTFFHKLILSCIAGMVFAGLIEFYIHVIDASDRAINGRFQQKSDHWVPVNSHVPRPR